MRILVHEFASGGGPAGRRVPASLVREGSAMVTALVEDLVALGRHEIVTTRDPRVRLAAPHGVEVTTLLPKNHGALLDVLIGSADAVWLVAPETGGWLARLAARAERHGKLLLGTSAAAVRRASNKATLPRRLALSGVRHPATRVLRRGRDPAVVAKVLGYPVVVKPVRGAGCEGVSLAQSARDLHRRIAAIRRSTRGPLLLQEFVPGVPASVSILADGRRAIALSLNAQFVRAASTFSYRGGRTPLDHPLAEQAIDAALRACRAVPGMRGYLGVDLVLTNTDAFVIEINPRLTTAYLGARKAFDENVAGLALDACLGSLPPPLSARRSVRFTASGRTQISGSVRLQADPFGSG